MKLKKSKNTDAFTDEKDENKTAKKSSLKEKLSFLKGKKKAKANKKSSKKQADDISNNNDELLQTDDFEEFENYDYDPITKRRDKKRNAKNGTRFVPKQKDNNRNVVSYEEVPIEDYDENNKKVSKKTVKIMILVGVVFVVCVLAVVIYANRQYLTFDNISYWVEYKFFGKKEGEGYPVTIMGTNVSDGNFDLSGDTLIYASDTSVVTLNPKGKCEYEEQLSFAQPVLKVNNSKSIVYNLGGKSFDIFSVKDKIYSGKTKENILCADVASNGNYVLVTECSGYLSKLTAYDKDNKQLYTYSFADFNIYAVTLDSSAEHCAVSGISAKNGSELTCVYVLDFTSEKPKVIYEFENNIIYVLEYLSDNNICAIGKTYSYVLNANKSEYKDYNYEGKTLSAYDVNTQTGCFALSLSRNGDGRNCDILYFNPSGELEKEINTDYTVSSLSLYKGRIGVLADNVVRIYGKNGDMLYETESVTNSRQIKLLNDHDVYILGLNKISLVDARKAE